MDREKVIKELTCCIYSEEECECPEDCPYVDDEMCQAKVMRDALALLKEQEAKEQLSDAVHETAKQFRQTIVRCKDCKYGEPWGVLIGCGTTKGFGITHEPDWFCADGERKCSELPNSSVGS